METLGRQRLELHHAPGGRVLAVNGALGRATESVTRITTLIGRLEKGAFGYKQFWTFKQFNTP